MQQYEAAEETNDYEQLTALYDNDYTPLRPIVNKNNVAVVSQKYSDKITNYAMRTGKSEEDYFEDSHFIGDNKFASLLNDKGEIQVRDSIYKYTPYGLFIVHESDYKSLLVYMNNTLDPPSIDPSNPNPPNPDEPSILDPKPIAPIACSVMGELSALSNGELVSLTNEIKFIVPQPIDDPCNPGGGGGGGSPSPNPTPTPTPPTNDELKEEYIDSLEPCSSFNGWMNFIFGQSDICYSHFSSKSRIKTKFWNQDYYIFQSIGTRVLHQFKTGFWYDAKIDELELGVINMSFDYEINYDLRSTLPPNINQQYIIDNSGTSSSIYDYNLFNKIDEINLPKWPFDAEVVVYLELPHGIDVSITDKELNKILWKNARKRLKKFYKSKNKTMPGEFLVVYKGTSNLGYSFSTEVKNRKDAKRIENWQAAQFEIEITFLLSTGAKLIYQTISPQKIGSYKNPKALFYGIGRRGRTWRGSLLSVE